MSACRYDAERHALVVDLEGRNFLLDPAHVRRNDTSAASINEWTGEKLNRSENISDDIEPDTIAPLGNYAVQILWQDGFNQVHRPRVLHGWLACIGCPQLACFCEQTCRPSSCRALARLLLFDCHAVPAVPVMTLVSATFFSGSTPAIRL